MRPVFLLSFALALVACKQPPVDAPKEIGELGAFLFANFEAEDTAGMEAGLLNLRDYLQAEDTSLDAKDRALTMPILKGADLGELKIPDGADADDQVNIAMSGLSMHAVDDARVLHTEPNQVCIESSSTIWAGREFLTDTACWLDNQCDRLDTFTEVRKENLLAKVWYDQFKNYRTFTVTEEDDSTTEIMVGRAWIEEVFPGDNGANSWDQLFHLDVYIPNPGKSGQTLRWFSMWSSITLGGITDDAYANLVIDGIDEAFIYGDEFLDGDIQTCTNDRDLAKPPR